MIRWLCSKAGLPAAAAGTFTTGGSQSNYMGLLLARDAFLLKHWNWSAQKSGLPPEARRMRILCSEAAHFTVEKSASQLGLGTDAVVRIDVDDHFRMKFSSLRSNLEVLKTQGLLPMAIVATAGTTDFGSIDPLPETAAVAGEAKAWLHVDAAYGGALLFSDSGPGLPKAVRGRLFEPFVSGSKTGTGLGLSIVKSLCERAGWTIALAADAGVDGKPTCFEVGVPKAKIVPPAKAAATGEARTP